jgi:hypothetical protein
MVEIISLNLRSQETNQACHTHARATAGGRLGQAWHGDAGRQAASGRGMVVLIFGTH